MRVAIFGSKGFVGLHLTRYLCNEGYDVIEYSSKTGDVFDADTGLLNSEFSLKQPVDCVVYLSQSCHLRNLPDKLKHLWGVNVTSAIDAARLSIAAGAKRFIYASTGNVYKQSLNPLVETSEVRRDDWYALSKLSAEEALSIFNNHIDVVCARIFAPYGYQQTERLIPNLVQRIKNNQSIIISQKNDSDMDGLEISLCFIDDLVCIIKKIIDDGAPNIINIASDEIMSIRQISEYIAEALNIEPSYQLAEESRKCNLIANTSLLKQLYKPDFTSFKDGLASVFNNPIATKVSS